MPGKYIFYDLETTGKGKKETPDSFSSTPKWEQILQVAAVVVLDVADSSFFAHAPMIKISRQTSIEISRVFTEAPRKEV